MDDRWKRAPMYGHEKSIEADAPCVSERLSDASHADARPGSGRSVLTTGIFRSLLCFAILIAVFVPRADRAQSSGQMQIIAGISVGAEAVTCNGPDNVCTGTSTLGYRGVGCRTGAYPLNPGSPIPICNTGYGGDTHSALTAMMDLPVAVAADTNGNVYVADALNMVVRKIDASGTISTVACINSSGQTVESGCTIPNNNSPFYLQPGDWPPSGAYFSAVAVDAQGNLYTGVSVPGQGGTVAMTSDPNGNVYALNMGSGDGFDVTITMNGNVLFSTQGGTLPFDSTFAGLAADANGNVYTVGTSGVYTEDLIQISPSGTVSVIANESGQVLLENMAGNGLAIDANRNFYALVNAGSDGSALIEEYNSTSQTWSVVAGTGSNGFNDGNSPPDTGDFTILGAPSSSPIDQPMPATSTDLNNATGIAIGPDGALYIADSGNNVVRKIAGVAPASGSGGTPPPTLTISPQSLPSGTVGVLYSDQLTATQNGSIDSQATFSPGSSGTVAWPSGVSMNQDGLISGAPSQAGTFSFTVYASDSITGGAGSQQYTVTIAPAASSGSGVPTVSGDANAIAINSNNVPGLSYNAVLNADSSISLLQNGTLLSGQGCPAFTTLSGTGLNAGAIFVDFANSRIYLAMISGSTLYAANESIDAQGNCTQGPLLQLSAPSDANSRVEMSSDPTQRNIYIVNSFGAFFDQLYVLPATPWSASALPTPATYNLDYSAQYGPIVIDASNHQVYVNDFSDTPGSKPGTFATSGFFVFDPTQSAVQHVVGYVSGSTTTRFNVGTLLDNGAGKLALVNENPNSSSANLATPITILDTTQFSFFANTQPATAGAVYIMPGAGLRAIQATSSYSAVSAADIDTVHDMAYVHAFNANNVTQAGMLLQYNLSSGGSTPEAVVNANLAVPQAYDYLGPWTQLNYDPQSSQVVLSVVAFGSGALGMTSSICSGGTPSFRQLIGNIGSPTPLDYPVVNGVSGYVYAISPNASFPATPSTIDALAPATGCSSSPLQISPTTLASGLVGRAYSQVLSATGGSGTGYSWQITSGETGLSLLGLNFSAGAITGTPTFAGNATVTVQVTDSQGDHAAQTYNIVVYAAISISPSTLPSGIVGGAYSAQLSATGGSGAPYGWVAASSSSAELTALGLTFSSTGLISGVPTSPGQINFAVQVSDSDGDSAQATYLLTISPALVSIAVTPANPNVAAGSTQQFVATGTYSDSSRQNLTTSVAWASSSTPVATISTGGLATAVAPGSTTITAVLGTISGSTTLTVPVSISEPITVTDSVSVVPLTLVAPIQVAAPVAYFTQGSLGFSSQNGTQQVVGIENIGEAGSSLALTSVVVSAGAPFTASAINCFSGATQTAIPSNAFCTVTITYRGSSPGTDAGTLTFTDNAALSNLSTSGSSPNFTQSIILNAAGGVTAPPAAPLGTVTIPTINETITVTDTVSAKPGPIVTGASARMLTTGGSAVTITGAGFTGATGVNFGNTPAISFDVNADTVITATSPAGTGTVDVTVTTPVATSPTSPADQSTYVPPTAPVIGASALEVTSSSTATFSGTVNPEGLATNAFFQYGLDPKYTGGGPMVYTQATAAQSVASDFAVHSVSSSVSGLIPNSLYHVRLVATNSAGSTVGPDQSFTTPAGTLSSTPKIGGSARITVGTGTYNVTITLTNNSAYPLSELTLLKATLGSVGALTFPSGTTLTNLAPGASATLTATFSTSAGASGQTVPLTLSGTYAAGSFSGSWTLGFRSITLP